MRVHLLFLILLSSSMVFGQDSLSTLHRQASQNRGSFKEGKSKYMIRGYFDAGFQQGNAQSPGKGFYMGNFSPILMYKESSKLFFEVEMNSEFHGEELEIYFEYADVSYVLNPFVIARAGYFLLPFGTFGEKLHPPWINRISTRPLGFEEKGMIPYNDIGVELRGAFFVNQFKLNYQAYMVNGPQLMTEPEGHLQPGQLSYGYHVDNNDNKAVGGRIGFFPFSNSMLELGVSGLTSVVGDRGTKFSKIGANFYALDLSLVRKIDAIRCLVDCKAQFNSMQIDKAQYNWVEDSVNRQANFSNKSTNFYGQISLHPAVSSKILRKLEAVARYSQAQTPSSSTWHLHDQQWVYGINYWIDWRTVIKLNYQETSSLNESSQGSAERRIFLQWAMGF